MASFYDELRESLGGDVSDELQSNYKLKPDQAQGVLDAVGPLVLGGLKRQAEQGGGDKIEELLGKYGDADGVDDLGGYFKRQSADADLDPDIGGLLGGRGGEAAEVMDKKLGLSPGMGAKLIPLLAPLILGSLMKKGKSGGGGAGGIGGLLDRDGDGQILDDLGGMLFSGGGANKAGCLGMLLGAGRRQPRG